MTPPADSAAAGARLAGKVALVCGAASGIGAAIVRRFRQEGATVLAAGLQPERLEALARDSGALWQGCDVGQESEVRLAVERAAGLQGRLDIVVNAAGILHSDDVAGIEDELWARTLEVNLTGVMRVCRTALPVMQRQQAGAIVNLASVAAFNASPGMASYSARKPVWQGRYPRQLPVPGLGAHADEREGNAGPRPRQWLHDGGGIRRADPPDRAAAGREPRGARGLCAVPRLGRRLVRHRRRAGGRRRCAHRGRGPGALGIA
jgi:hypothetical protein